MGRVDVVPPDAATVDHVIPTSAGGTNAMSNLVTACPECNVGLMAINGMKARRAAVAMGQRISQNYGLLIDGFEST